MSDSDFALAPEPTALRAAEQLRALEEIRTLDDASTSILMERMGWAAMHGMTFGGKRDLYTVLGYERNLTIENYRERYRRGGIAGRVVDAKPEATWRGTGEVWEDDDPEVLTEFERAFDEHLIERLKLWSIFQRVDKLASLGRYAVLFIGAKDGKDPSQPLSKGSGPKDLLFFDVYGEDDAPIDELELDFSNPRFGQPKTYQLKRVNTSGVKSVIAPRAHWSRCIHVCDPLDDNVYGPPVLERMWNDFDNLEKVAGGGAEAYWMRAHQGTVFSLDKSVEFSPDQLKAFRADIDKYINGMSRVIRSQGLEAKTLGSDVAEFKGSLEAIQGLIAGAAGIPRRILFGAEAGELASSQDRDNWNDQIKDRRTSKSEPMILRPTLDRLIEYGYLPKPKKAYTPKWPDVMAMSQSEQLDAAVKASSINKNMGETVITGAEVRERYLDLEPLDDSQVEPIDTPADQQVDEPLAASSGSPLLDVADRQATSLRRLFSRSMKATREGVSLTELETALSHKDITRVNIAAHSTLDEFRHREADVFELLLNALAASGNLAARRLPSAPVVAMGIVAAASKTHMAFDKTNPAAVRWAREHAAELVTEVTNETREALNSMIAFAFDEGVPPKVAASMIKSSIGLTTPQAEAVSNLYGKLVNGAGRSVKAGSKVVRVPATGATRELLEKATSSYADRLLKQRALTIAVHETLQAANEGQRELWRQAEGKGFLTGREMKTLIQVDPCPLCSDMAGEVVPMDEDFSHGLPPFHVRCRCVEGLV